MKDGVSLDGRAVAIIALAGLFGIFTFGMTMTCARFLYENITNIDLLKKRQVYVLAVRIPRNTPPSPKYRTITYPLAEQPNGYDQNGQADGSDDPVSSRDRQATKTFAILTTEEDENPWDLGYWRNFKSVMGGNIVEWLLPIKHSPCCNHNDPQSMYELGPVVSALKKRYGIPEDKLKTEHGIEMHDTGASRQ
jgi:palmitoyltransferase